MKSTKQADSVREFWDNQAVTFKESQLATAPDSHSTNPIDQHGDFEESDFDFVWIKKLLNNLSDVPIVFETPKKDGIANDLKNMQYFREL